ncbi:MAG: four helix bundle protein [Gammaproteobacteria bacterium]|jgi:four helix bundle protein
MDHKDLEAWKQAICLVEEVYKISANFPRHEMYGLTSQARRAAVSIPSNISEGAARNGSKEYNNFLGIALGSLAELETQLIIASRLNYADVKSQLVAVTHVRSLIIGLRNYIQTK